MKSIRVFFAALFAATFVSSMGTPAGLLAAGYGTVTGQFVIDGDVPVVEPLVPKGGKLPNGMLVKDPEVCGLHGVPDDSLVVDPATKGIANIAVYLVKAPTNVHPDLKKSAKPVVEFDQKDCRYVPHMLIVRTDQKVLVKSSDSISHNVHTIPFANDAVNLIQSPNSKGDEFPVPVPERLPMPVKCDIHAWMQAWWIVVNHPYATATGADGKFTIEKVPAGTHEFTIWHERSGYLFGAKKRTVKVVVEDGKTFDLGVQKIPATTFEKK